MSIFTELKATYIKLTGRSVPVGTSTAKLQEMVMELEKQQSAKQILKSGSSPKKKSIKKSIPIKDIGKTKEGKANKKTWEERKGQLVHGEALQSFKEALSSDPSPSKAMKTIMESYPKLNRKQFFHTAVEAGINIRTAKNYFDRHHDEEV